MARRKRLSRRYKPVKRMKLVPVYDAWGNLIQYHRNGQVLNQDKQIMFTAPFPLIKKSGNITYSGDTPKQYTFEVGLPPTPLSMDIRSGKRFYMDTGLLLPLASYSATIKMD